MVVNVNIFGMYIELLVLSEYNYRLVIRKNCHSFKPLAKNPRIK